MSVFVGRVLGAGAVALGVVVLVGWTIENEALTRIVPGSTSLKVNTALCLVFLGTACVIRRTHHERLRTVLEVTGGI